MNSPSTPDSPPAMKLRGGAPDAGPAEGLNAKSRKLSSMSTGSATHAHAAGPRPSSPPPCSEDETEMDMKLAHKLGISDSLSDGHISSSGRTSFSSPTSLHPGILKHSDHDARAGVGVAGEPAGGAESAGLPGLPGPGSPAASSVSAYSPLGSATPSAHSEPRRRVSIAVQDETPPSKKMSTASFGSSVGAHSHHSHLSKATELHQHSEENGKTPGIAGNGTCRQRSCIDIVYNKIYPDNDIESSSWYVFCKKVRKKDEEAAADSWEPPHWQAVCPYPFCLTYRQFARFLGLALVVLLLWGSAYAVMGDTLAPGGPLFSLAMLSVAAHFGGWLVSLTTLPALVGMLLVGILFQNVGLYQVSGEFFEVVGVMRKIALVIILTRAGLDLDPPALRRLLWTLLRIGLVPWLVECVVLAVMTYYLLGLPWIWGFLLGATVAAVSPAVTVPCLFRLRSKGYGTVKGIPTLIIAISGIDDAASVAGFGIIHSIMFSHDSLLYQIFQGPLSIIMGLGFGVLWGVLAKYVPEKNDPFVVPLRVLMLFGGGLIAVLGSESIGLGGAGPLAVVAAAFVSCYSWTQQGWEVEENPVATAFEIFWMIFEPILFGLTGSMIKLDELDPRNVSMVIACLVAGFVIRIIATILVATKSKLNTKEKVFVSLSLMAKATVQAALCTVPMDSLSASDREGDERRQAEIFLTTCVMSILLTAPTIAILMTILGPRLLTKTTLDPEFPENWRRHTRPSLRDITIIAEGDEDDEDDNLGKLSRRSSRRRSSTKQQDKDPAKDKDAGKEAAKDAVDLKEVRDGLHTTSLTTTSIP